MHNNIIQMIDNASVRGNELEETLEQTQAAVTHLHEKPRKTDSPDRTPHRFPMNPSGRPSYPTQIFEGRNQDLDSWPSRVRNKLHRCVTDNLPEGRIGEEVARHIAPRLRATSLNRFGTAEEIFDYLTRAYGDPDRWTAERANRTWSATCGVTATICRMTGQPGHRWPSLRTVMLNPQLHR
jgi:hypothetical protein